jgi:hypothetical protein
MNVFLFGESGKRRTHEGVVENYLRAQTDEEFITCVAYWELQAVHNFLGTRFEENGTVVANTTISLFVETPTKEDMWILLWQSEWKAYFIESHSESRQNHMDKARDSVRFCVWLWECFQTYFPAFSLDRPQSIIMYWQTAYYIPDVKFDVQIYRSVRSCLFPIDIVAVEYRMQNMGTLARYQ